MFAEISHRQKFAATCLKICSFPKRGCSKCLRCEELERHTETLEERPGGARAGCGAPVHAGPRGAAHGSHLQLRTGLRCPSPRHITLSEARSRLYPRRSWPPISHFAAFFEIYNIFTILRRSNINILQNFVKKLCDFEEKKKKTDKFCKIQMKISENFDKFLQKFEFQAVQKCANLVDLEKC